MIVALISLIALAEEPVFGPLPPPEPTPAPEVVDAPTAMPDADRLLFDRLLAEPSETDAAKPTAKADIPSLGAPNAPTLPWSWGIGVAALGGAAVLLWRRREATPGGVPAPALQVLARTALDANSGLALVEVDGRRLVVGIGSTPPVLVTDLSAPTTAAPATVAPAPRSAPASATAAPTRTPAAKPLALEPAIEPRDTAVDALQLVARKRRAASSFQTRLDKAQSLVDDVLAKRVG